MSRKPSACAVVQDSEGKVLLHLRSDNGQWGLPGGGIEMDETAGQAVVREVLEETGYEVEVVRLIGVYSAPESTSMTYPDGNTVVYVALCFECRVIGGSPALSDETLEVNWFASDCLPASVRPGHVQRIHDALAAERAAFMR